MKRKKKQNSQSEISDEQIDQIFCRYEEKAQEDKRTQNKKRANIFLFSVILFVIVIIIGTIGYVYLFGLSWIDAFYNASLVLTAIGVEVDPQTVGQKLFIIVYSLISVLLLLSIANSVADRIFAVVEDTS